MKSRIIIVTVLISILCFLSCRKQPNNEQKLSNRDEKIDELDSLTYVWRYQDLDTALYYSQKALDYFDETKEGGKKIQKYLDTLNLGRAYLTHAHLYYLCHNFNKADTLIKNYESIVNLREIYRNIKTIDNPYNKYDYIDFLKKFSGFKSKSDKDKHFFTYLLMLRNLQKIEIATRLLNFTDISRYLDRPPLIDLHKPKEGWKNANNRKLKKVYREFYESKEWYWAKMFYNIKYATYNYSFEFIDKDSYRHFSDCFDALAQLSRVSYPTIQESVRQFDKAILYNYNYCLANVYSALAQTIGSVPMLRIPTETPNPKEEGIIPFLNDFFKKGEKSNKYSKINHFHFQEDSTFLIHIYNEIDTKKDTNDTDDKVIRIKNEIAHYFYQRAFDIYFDQLGLLKNDPNIYWKANFLQDVAVIKMNLENTGYEEYLKNIFKEKFTDIDIKKNLHESDFLFKKWCGNHIDYFQLCGSKLYLAEYYLKHNNTVTARSYLDSAKIINNLALSVKYFSIRDDYNIVLNYCKIDTSKQHQEEKERLKFIIETTYKNHRINNIRQEDHRDRIAKENQKKNDNQKITIKLLSSIGVLIGTLIIIFFRKGKKRKEEGTKRKEEEAKREEEEIKRKEKEIILKKALLNEMEIKQNAEDINDCFLIYSKWRKSPDMIKHLFEKIAYTLFNDIEKIPISDKGATKYIKGIDIGILYVHKEHKNKSGEIEKLDGFSYDEYSGIKRYRIEKKDHPALKICCNKEAIIQDKKKYVEIKENVVHIYNFNEKELKYINEDGGFILGTSKNNLYYDKLDDYIHSLLYIPLKDKESGEILGVITFQTIKENLDKELENCKALANFIAVSIKGESDDLEILNDSLKDISRINYNNFSYSEMQKLFRLVYEYMFGKTTKSEKEKEKEKEKEDLFSVTLWLEEEKNEKDIKLINEAIIKKDSYTSPRLRNYTDTETKILVEYSYERYINKDGKTEDLTEDKFRNPTYLHDYSTRPALYCFAKSKADIKNMPEKEINIHDFDFSNWKLGKEERKANGDIKTSDEKIDEVTSDQKKWKGTEYYKYISKLHEEAKKEDYQDLIIEKYIENLDRRVFYTGASNKGLVTNSLLFYPIVVGEEKERTVKGVLSFQHQKSFYFKDNHRIMLKIIAQLIGISMDNAELIQQNDLIMQQNTQYLISEKFRFQLDNHFTKNALLKVGDIIDKKHKDRRYFLQFEELFEYLVDASKKKEGIPIKEDIQFLEKFISMNNVLYPTIEFEYHCDTNLMEKKIPPLILQPFVENSIRHGIKPIREKIEKGKITINYEVTEDTDLGSVLECTITDNGQGREAAEEKKRKREENERNLGAPPENNNTSVGISSTIDLLRHLYPKIQYPVQIIDLKNGEVSKGTKVIVKILLS